MAANVWTLFARIANHLTELWAAYQRLCTQHETLLGDYLQMREKWRSERERAVGATALDPRCCVCMTAAATHGYLHGSTVHHSVCAGCAGQRKLDGTCVVCREPAVLVAVYQAGVSAFECEILV